MGLNVTLLLYAKSVETIPSINGVNVEIEKLPFIKGKLIRAFIGRNRLIKKIKSLYIPHKTVIHIYNTQPYAFFLCGKKRNVFFERGEVPYFAEVKTLSFRIYEWLGLKVAKYATGMVVQTPSLQLLYRDFYGIKNIVVSNMFVDTTRFNNLNKVNRKHVISYCGTISIHKDGVDDLIKAFAKVSHKYPDYQLWIIGGFEKLYDDESILYSLVKSLKIADKVVFTGRVSPDDLPLMLMQSSILALARPNNNQAKYGFPTKVGEYLYTGNPVVLTEVGDLNLFLHHKDNCLFARPNDYEDFADKLLWVIEHQDEASQIGIRGKQTVEKEFNVLGQCKRVLSFMERVSK